MHQVSLYSPKESQQGVGEIRSTCAHCTGIQGRSWLLQMRSITSRGPWAPSVSHYGINNHWIRSSTSLAPVTLHPEQSPCVWWVSPTQDWKFVACCFRPSRQGYTYNPVRTNVWSVATFSSSSSQWDTGKINGTIQSDGSSSLLHCHR